MAATKLANKAKFIDPDRTADGDIRASVALSSLETLWLNTGTLCNLTCANCYIESSPKNDRLAYLSAAEAESYFDEIKTEALGTRLIGITGGEPFMNPEIMEILGAALSRGFEVLILTNAMKPLAQKKDALLDLHKRHGDRMSLRVSLDHFSKEGHELERGASSWRPTLDGLKWLSANGFSLSIAGRTFLSQDEAMLRGRYAELFAAEDIAIDAQDPAALILFPEMDMQADVPEVTTGCWDQLGVRPEDQMCATSRMVVKRKGAEKPVVVPCTLLPYDPQFELGSRLKDAEQSVKLNHPFCAQFCVLGGSSCSP